MPKLNLPPYSFRTRQPDPPHRQTVIAVYERTNKHGVAVRFEVITNHRGNVWWVRASIGFYRASNTLRTTSVLKAHKWIEAVKSGQVDIAESW